MSLRRIDLRFALPCLPRHAQVFGLDEWRAALVDTGVDVGVADEPDLAVAPSERVDEAVSTGAASVILEGRSGVRALTRAGYLTRAFLPLPTIREPDMVVPIGPGSPARYALARWRPADGAVKRARNALVARAFERGAIPLRPLQIVGSPRRESLFLRAAADQLGLPDNPRWFLTLGQGDELGRGVFHIFTAEHEDPSWVLKFARVPGYEEPFSRDQRALELVASAGPQVSRHAPRFLGRLQVESHHASVETAAIGERVSTLLVRDRSNARVAIDEIADWIIRLGKETASPESTLGDERRRLESKVLPAWGLDAGYVMDLRQVGSVLQHNDLGSWNIVWNGPGQFTAVDWESAVAHGLPLWDLLYFLVDVLPLLDGARSAEERTQAAVRLLRGEAASSETFFNWIRRAVNENGIPPGEVGRLASLCWLHHGLSHRDRQAALGKVDVEREATVPPVERIAPLWLADPTLGPGWTRWRN